MKLEIVTPEKSLYNGEIKLVQVPGKNGCFEILNNHAPIISTLEKGQVRIVNMEDKEELFPIESGVLECHSNKIIILIEK